MTPIEQAIEALERCRFDSLNMSLADMEFIRVTTVALKALQQAAQDVELPPLPETTYVLGVEGDGYSRDRLYGSPAWDEDAMRAYALAALAAHQARQAVPQGPTFTIDQIHQALLDHGVMSDTAREDILAGLAAAPTPEATPQTDDDCPNCKGSEVRGFKRGLRCPNCDGTGDVHSADGTWRGRCFCPEGLADPHGKAPEATQPTQTDPRCAGCDIANGCHEYCRCQPTQAEALCFVREAHATKGGDHA